MTVAAPSAPRTELDAETLEKARRDYEAALPRIETHAKVHFNFIRDPGRRDDCIANTIGIGWKHWLSALRHGKDPNTFISSIAEMAVRQVRAGRRVDRQERPKDVVTPRAQRAEGFTVASLPDHTGTGADDNKAIDALRDNTQTPPPDQAAFRIDIPAWLAKLTEKKRGIVNDLMMGDTTQQAAEKHGVSEGRVSQIRREAYEDLHEYVGGRGR